MAALIRALVLALIAATGLGSYAETAREYQLKAVFVFNLAQFVEWPASAFPSSNSPIVIGILGRNPFDRWLDEVVKGETIRGRSLVVQHYKSFKDLKPCHILFISESEKNRLREILANFKDQPVLTVSDMDDFARSDEGMVRIYTNDQNKLRLRINRPIVTASGLKVSAKLLRVADVSPESLNRPKRNSTGIVATAIPSRPRA